MKGKAGPKPDDHKVENASVDEAQAKTLDKVMECDDCEFKSQFLAEMNEHLNGTGHTGFEEVVPENPVIEVPPPPPSVQTELFSEPPIVKRDLLVHISDERLKDLHEEIGILCSESLNQKELAEAAKDQVKILETKMQEIRAKIKSPFEYQTVDCQWRIVLEENSKKLVRLDNGEVVQTAALSAEDRERELRRAADQAISGSDPADPGAVVEDPAPMDPPLVPPGQIPEEETQELEPAAIAE